MVNHKTYGKKGSKSRGKFQRVSTYLVIVFIFFGLVINAIPMFSFYFGSYIQDTVHNPSANGSELQYYGFYGSAPGPNLTEYAYGFEFFITGLGNSVYHVDETVYNVSNSVGKPIGLNIKDIKTPFIGSMTTKVYSSSSNMSYQDSPFLQLVLPKNTTPAANYLTLKITGNTREYAAEAYLGYPSYLNTTAPSDSLVNYVAVDGQYILANFVYPGANFTSFFHTIEPNAMAFTSNLPATILLGSGNVAISQDWLGWISYGFDLSYPVNVALLAVGGLLAIIRFREGF